MPKSQLKSYITGFIASIILTLMAFLVVTNPSYFKLSSIGALVTILVLAIIQFSVQAFCFLHLGSESGPRWNLAVFGGALALILIIVIGSIWIMSNLNYNMTPQQINQYLIDQSG